MHAGWYHKSPSHLKQTVKDITAVQGQHEDFKDRNEDVDDDVQGGDKTGIILRGA